jgi:hypothetical protein
MGHSLLPGSDATRDAGIDAERAIRNTAPAGRRKRRVDELGMMQVTRDDD